MLETLPYSKISSTDDYMEYVFSADQFIFDSELIDEISQGDFRLFPLISLSSEDEPYTFWLVDAPLTLKSEVSSHPNFFYNNKFSPLFNIIASSRNIHVFLLNHDVELSYCIEIPIDEMLHLSKMSVVMMSEEEIYNRISKLR